MIENYNVTYSGSETPAVGDVILVYYDLTENAWITLHPTYNSTTKTWSGTITTTGFTLPVGYDATTPVLITVSNQGTYVAHLWFTTA